MVTKIISGAYNDVERGALDFAVERGIPHGGWAPLGWLSKVELLAQAHELQEVPHNGSPNYAERNIFDADGTLLITEGGLAGAAELAKNFAARYKHPLVHIDLARISRFQAAEAITAWIAENGIQVLHATGGGPGRVTGLYQATRDILGTVFHMGILSDAVDHRDRPPEALEASRPSRGPAPRTIDDALDALVELLSLKEKARIGRTRERDLQALTARLGAYIENSLGWWQDNDALIDSCRSAPDSRRGGRNTPGEILIHTLWRRLSETYGLRVIR